jgi:hypothetical protein
MSITNCRVCKKELKTPMIIGQDYCQDTCLDDFCKIYNDNYLVNKYKDNPLVFELLVNTSISCLNSPKHKIIYKPKPKNFDTFDKMKNCIPLDFIKNLHEYFSQFKEDIDIVNKFTNDFYYFLKFTIITNNTNLIASKLNNSKNVFLEKDPKNIYEGNIQFDINYSPSVEKNFKDINLHYLFHGSSSSNWYGMLRNGIKNCSGTELMVNGAVYGSGIYLSESLNFAKTYSAKYKNTDGLLIIGVCQLKNPINNYFKAPNIYVVPDDSEIILRHIIILNNSTDTIDIEKYYREKLPSELCLSNKNIFKINNKRLNKEIECIEKYKKKMDKSIIEEINFDSKFEPYLQINMDIKLVNNSSNIKINFIFRDFPNHPPIVFLENILINNKIFLNKNIYIDSNILPKTWNIKCKLIDYLKKIIDLLIDPLNKIENIENIKINDVIDLYDNYINKNNLFVY